MLPEIEYVIFWVDWSLSEYMHACHSLTGMPRSVFVPKYLN